VVSGCRALGLVVVVLVMGVWLVSDGGARCARGWGTAAREGGRWSRTQRGLGEWQSIAVPAVGQSGSTRHRATRAASAGRGQESVRAAFKRR
jgi:hypothetical protein